VERSAGGLRPCQSTPFPAPDGHASTCEACNLGKCVVADAGCIGSGQTLSQLLFYTGHLPDYTPPLEASWEMLPGVQPATLRFHVKNDADHAVDHLWLVYREVTDDCVDPSYCPVKSATLAHGYLATLAPGEAQDVDAPVVFEQAQLGDSGFPVTAPCRSRRTGPPRATT